VRSPKWGCSTRTAASWCTTSPASRRSRRCCTSDAVATGQGPAQHPPRRRSHRSAVVRLVRLQRGQRVPRRQRPRRGVINTDLAAPYRRDGVVHRTSVVGPEAQVLGLLTGSVAGLATNHACRGLRLPHGSVIIGNASGVVCFYAVARKNRLNWDDRSTCGAFTRGALPSHRHARHLRDQGVQTPPGPTGCWGQRRVLLQAVRHRAASSARSPRPPCSHLDGR